MWFKGKKLSDQIQHGTMIQNKSGREVALIKVRQDTPICMTIVVEHEVFNVEVRSPQAFDDLFKGWTVLRHLDADDPLLMHTHITGNGTRTYFKTL